MILSVILTVAVSTGPPLPPCPDRPNCVSTQAAGAHAIAPIRYRSGKADAMQRLLAVQRAMPRATVVQSGSGSVRAEFRTRIFRFVDDAQFIVDEATKTINFRSASRAGHYDFGVNRRRMETIRRAFEAAAGGSS